MKLATIAYVPIAHRLHPKPFLANIRHYKSSYPIHFFSEYSGPGYESFITIDDPDHLKKSRNRVAINNYLFLCALKIAANLNLDRFLFLESDSRCGCHHWDERMFNESMCWPDALAWGTPAVWHDAAFPSGVREAVLDGIEEYTALTGLRVANFKPKPQQKRIGPAWFLIGSVCVYNTRAMLDIFHGFDKSPGAYACSMPAFDLQIGIKALRLFGDTVTRKLRPMVCAFSGFGNKVLSESQRKEGLLSGRFAAVHQCKANDAWLK